MKEIIDITPISEDEIMWAGLAKALQMAEANKSLYTINKKRYAEMQKAYKLLKELVLECDPDAQFECKCRDPFQDICDIGVRCAELDVMTQDMPAWEEIVNLADNFSVTPIQGNRIWITFTFLDVMTKRT